MRGSSFVKRVWSIHARKGDHFCVSTKSVIGGVWRDHFFQWPVGLKLKEFFSDHPEGKYNLYFCPTPFTKPKRLKQYVRASQLLWSDLDDCHPERIAPVPQIAWQSSPDRYAALWLLVDQFEPSVIEEKNRSLAYQSEADKSGWDLTQVLRVPGTRNHKYPGAPRGKLLWFKENAYSLDDIPDHMETEDLKPIEVLKKWRRKMSGALYRTLTTRRATNGKRSEVLWKLEAELADIGCTEEEVLILVKHSVWNKFVGRRDEDRQLKREIHKIFETRPKIGARKTLGDQVREEEKRPDAPDEDEEEGSAHGRIVRMSDVEEEEVKWLWYPYIAYGKVTIIEGDPGLGKSWMTLAIASAISKRDKLPTQERATQGRVLLMSAEDGLGDTLKGRLRMLGANTHKIFAYDLEHEDGLAKLDEVGLAEIEDEINKWHPKLLIIDPLVAYMGAGVDLHKANETREIMTGLARLAARTGVAVAVVRHLRKGGADKSIYRGLGSIDLTAAARSVVLVGRDPEDEDGRIMCHIKCNIAPLGSPIRYYLHRKTKRPFSWDGPCDVSVEDVMKADQVTTGKSDFDLAKDFLSNILKNDGALADTIKRDAEGRGISIKTLLKAKRELRPRVVEREGRTWWVAG